MDVRPALESDIPDLLPLFRGYCDFYRASPSDDGLIAMSKALIEGPDSDGMLLVARDGDAASVGFAAVGWKWSSLRGACVAHRVGPLGGGGGIRTPGPVVPVNGFQGRRIRPLCHPSGWMP